MLKGQSKTPVSYLQEHLISKHLCPKYELVFNGVGMQKPKFTYRVQVGEISKEGTGKNKQEAKHRAAENMLKALHLVESNSNDEEDEEDSEDLMDPVKNNHVGILKQFCQNHSYPDPVYDVEETAGPPHSKIFKMVCSVSHIRQDGIARTKKAAKHIAAEKMFRQLKQCVKDPVFKEEVVIIPEVKLSVEEELEKDKLGKNLPLPNIHNRLAFYKDHHNAYLELQDESPTLSKLVNDSIAADYSNSVELAENIARELKVKLSIPKTWTTVENNKLILMSMSLTPPICEIGFDYKNAAFKLLQTLLILSK